MKNKKTPATARERYLAEHPNDAKVQTAIIGKICKGIGGFRNEAESFGNLAVKLCNDAREIGGDVLDLWDMLPGKQMTTDFWQQMSDLFVDQYGHKITIEQLKIFVRIHTNAKEEITEPQVALSWRQDLLLAAGFELTGGTVGMTAQRADYYNRLLQNLDPRKIFAPLEGLVNDERYGPVASWPDERKERVMLQIGPIKKKIDELYAELAIKNVSV